MDIDNVPIGYLEAQIAQNTNDENELKTSAKYFIWEICCIISLRLIAIIA